ncbi:MULTISPECIES: hypothetical protein [Pseudomonas syringae group]|uniref:hypothetical protein n=1 Tax=Pseudomonas syringae group TaxID=136849 RepID=UPI000AFBCBC0|nr:hypothetical protein [Pseudomonas syringae group genomosp. 7]UNB64593.1 hypothetical protein MME54_07405 [Pseudomonas syringae pv. helianthi]
MQRSIHSAAILAAGWALSEYPTALFQYVLAMLYDNFISTGFSSINTCFRYKFFYLLAGSR